MFSDLHKQSVHTHTHVTYRHTQIQTCTHIHAHIHHIDTDMHIHTYRDAHIYHIQTDIRHIHIDTHTYH